MNVFKDKKVLLTGHTGFKGAWLTVWLYSLGAEIMGYALEPDTEPSLWQLLSDSCHGGLAPQSLCKSVIADVRDKEKVKKIILDFQPDFVFHLAAQAIVRESYSAPLNTFDTNVMGTAYILDALRFLEKPCIAVMITTDKVYKNNETGHAYREDDAFGGYDPYSASKAAAEIVIDSYRNSFFYPEYYEKHHKAIASARAGNVIGGGDWAKDRLIPDIVRALFDNREIIIRNPYAVRPWQHVLEPLSGYLTLATKMYNSWADIKSTPAYNFGPNPDDTLTVKQMAEVAVRIWGGGKLVYPQLANQLHEAKLLSLSIQKAETELGWKPKWNVQQALENTINWYKSYKDVDVDVYAMCMEQIAKFHEIKTDVS